MTDQLTTLTEAVAYEVERQINTKGTNQ